MLLNLAARRGMLIGEINGEPAQTHPGARVFVEEGFVATAMGLQARPVPAVAGPRPGPYGTRAYGRGLGSLDATGIGIAATHYGGDVMAEQKRIENDPTLIGNSKPRQDETSETEHDRVRSSNDRDQQLEREGIESEHNRGYDDAAQAGRRRDVDPDSADAGIDRDDIGSV